MACTRTRHIDYTIYIYVPIDPVYITMCWHDGKIATVNNEKKTRIIVNTMASEKNGWWKSHKAADVMFWSKSCACRK